MNSKTTKESNSMDSTSKEEFRPSDLSDNELQPLLNLIIEVIKGYGFPDRKPNTNNKAPIDSKIGLEFHKFLRNRGCTESNLIEKDVNFWKELNTIKCNGEFKKITDWRHGQETTKTKANWGKTKNFNINRTFFARNWKQIDLAFDSDETNPYDYASIPGSSELWRTVILHNKRFHKNKNMIKAIIDAAERPKDGDTKIETGKDKEMRRVINNFTEWENQGNSINGKDYEFCYNLIQELRSPGKITSPLHNKNDDGKNVQKGNIQIPLEKPLNLILYGPPGTGKTYKAVNEAVEICLENDVKKLTDRDAVMIEFKRLMSEGRIDFVTFHQSFSYEDFIEGLRPTTNSGETVSNNSSGGFSLIPHSGVFLNICNRAQNEFLEGNLDSNRRVYQISLAQKTWSSDNLLKHFENSLITCDLAKDIDWSDSKFDEVSEFNKEWQVQLVNNVHVDKKAMEQLYKFRSELNIGDYVVLANQKKYRFFAVGEVVGPYYFEQEGMLPPHRREVKWFWKNEKGKSFSEFYPKNFSEQLITELNTSTIDWDSLNQVVSEILSPIEFVNGKASEFAGKTLKPLREYNPRKEDTWGWKSYNVLLNHPNGIKFENYINEKGRPQDLKWDYDRGRVSVSTDEFENIDRKSLRKFVLIIDEINRANISKVFGELITLLEKDKRIGEKNEIMVRLPYSGKRFGIPPNLHIIGTMNTADQSIAVLDKALRRRFKFQEIMPDSQLDKIPDITLNKKDEKLVDLFSKINERIEYLYDREYQIGFTYFINCTDIQSVKNVFTTEVIPLLADYFYDDRGKVAEVLGDWPESNENSIFKGCFFDATPILPIRHNSRESPSSTETKRRWTVRKTIDFGKLNLS